MYWNLNSIYMQFECQYAKSSEVSIDQVQLSRGMYCLKFRSFVARGIYCLEFGFFVARGMHCLKLV